MFSKTIVYRLCYKHPSQILVFAHKTKICVDLEKVTMLGVLSLVMITLAIGQVFALKVYTFLCLQCFLYVCFRLPTWLHHLSYKLRVECKRISACCLLQAWTRPDSAFANVQKWKRTSATVADFPFLFFNEYKAYDEFEEKLIHVTFLQ